MAVRPDTKVLIVVFDALRPEFVTPELMPNLTAFADRGVRYPNSRSTFLTETRVNQTTVVTGCTPARHGIVANSFVAPSVAPGHVLNTQDEDQLAAAFERTGGHLFEAPSLSQRLAAAHLTYASLSSGTPGGGRLIHHDAEATGGFRLAMHRPDAMVPQTAIGDLTTRIGVIPTPDRPGLAWTRWAVDAYLGYVATDLEPDVMLLWLSEPDETFHFCGIGSPESLTAIRHVDAQFGRILSEQADAIEAGQLNIIAMSDHGQITLAGPRLDLVALMNDAGFRAAKSPSDEADYAVVAGNAGGIWVREADTVPTEPLVDWLRSQDWCGPVFTRSGALGTLTLETVNLAHERAPDIAFACHASDAVNAFGIAGTTPHDAPYPAGGGCHGGLSRYELHTLLAMGGSAFKCGAAPEAPAGNTDITPTVLRLLGLDAGDGLDGRCLAEAFKDEADEPDAPVTHKTLTSSNEHGPLTHLSVSTVGTTRYLNEAWTE